MRPLRATLRLAVRPALRPDPDAQQRAATLRDRLLVACQYMHRAGIERLDLEPTEDALLRVLRDKAAL